MDFVAIDFETANEKRNSACSLGIAVVKNNKIEEVKYWLIKPCEMRFESMNVWIHGIEEEDVENEPNMGELWDEIKPYLENKLVIAHNASFDMSVLRKTLDSYEIDYPEFDYSCTMVMARNHFTGLENYKLNTIANHLGIDFKHHHAGEDAAAAAKILIKICEELNIDTLEELSSKLDLRIGKIFKGGYRSAGTFRARKAIVSEEVQNSQEFIADNQHKDMFQDKIVVFTGPLESMTRSNAVKKLKNVGGIPGGSVTKKTNYLVVGIRGFEKLPEHRKSTKFRRAETLIKQGQDLKIISEEEFLKNVK